MIADRWLGRLGRTDPRRRPRGAVRSSARRPPSQVLRRRFARRPGRRLTIAFVVVLALLAGSWLWLRDSSLVAVHRVTVTGAKGPDAAQIRSALITAARSMTTLDVRMKQLDTAVAPYPDVKSLKVSTQFPHGMRIRVIEEIPVAVIMISGRAVAVAGDGILLHDGARSASLPLIPMQAPPGGTRLTDRSALSDVALLAAAPYQLLAKISEATTSAAHGLVVQLRGGQSIYFGDERRLTAKWIAATAVLADPHSAGAAYVDVTVPERPAAGAGSAATSTTAGAGVAGSAGPAGAASTTAGGG